MKQAAFIIWIIGALILGVADTSGWPLVAGIILLPAFFIGNPWYSSFRKKTAEHK